MQQDSISAAYGHQAVTPLSGDSVIIPINRIETFSAKAKQHANKWIESFERISRTNRWNTNVKIDRLALYLEGPARD